MKKNNITHVFCAFAFLLVFLPLQAHRVFVYCPDRAQGLHIAQLSNDSTWQHIGQLCASDYSAWGSEKKMYAPCLCRASDGTWRLVFSVNNFAPCLAVAYSEDLVTWRPQDYPRMSAGPCTNPFIIERNGGFDVLFSGKEGRRKTHASFDFRQWGADEPSDIMLKVATEEALIDGKTVSGQSFELNDQELQTIISYFQTQQRKAEAARSFMGLPQVGKIANIEATLTVRPHQKKAISDQLIGIFFEDISYAADGGLYAEMVQNRDFEYTSKDRREWNATTAWKGDVQRVDTLQPLSLNNPHYLLLSGDEHICNLGWDGMNIKSGETYLFSFYVRTVDCKKKRFVITLRDANDTLSTFTPGKDRGLGNAVVTAKGNGWKRYSVSLKALADCPNALLSISAVKKGTAAVDMVSLFPQDTYKGHGLRRDLAETIAALHPRFVRFPGGCMSHGQGLDNIYHWNHTVGPWQDRRPDFNIWHYHQTRGLGFYEFFQWCEDMGAEPLPVLAAGVPCQNSQPDKDGYGGQQGGIPMADMPAYCDEICNLIDWANGDPATNKWAKMRAEAGHPEPFNLKYLGIGNEDIISTTFEERCLMIARAVKKRHPDIKICGTVGPFHAPSADYIEGWKFAKQHPDLFYMVDEHYYESSGWFMANQDYYDGYERAIADGQQPSPKVYLGEWSAKGAGTNRSTVEAALAEAAYLCNVERNGDIVEMTSYAPLLCKNGHSNWNPDLIYFDNNGIQTTPSYHTQRLFGEHSGNLYLSSDISYDFAEAPGSSQTRNELLQELSGRVVASVVEDSRSGAYYIKVVNTLPQPVTLRLKGLSFPPTATVCGFRGSSGGDRQVLLLPSEHVLTGDSLLLQPYSLSVVTIP